MGVNAEAVSWLGIQATRQTRDEIWSKLRQLPKDCVPILVTHQTQVILLIRDHAGYAQPNFIEREP